MLQHARNYGQPAWGSRVLPSADVLSPPPETPFDQAQDSYS